MDVDESKPLAIVTLPGPITDHVTNVQSNPQTQHRPKGTSGVAVPRPPYTTKPRSKVFRGAQAVTITHEPMCPVHKTDDDVTVTDTYQPIIDAQPTVVLQPLKLGMSF